MRHVAPIPLPLLVSRVELSARALCYTPCASGIVHPRCHPNETHSALLRLLCARVDERRPKRMTSGIGMAL
ncbi:hypothetical protein FA09DRAFT_332646 [Tilletiopsis washingtonensis]|jgi:hypothetical protein|uniref:Uncharacterized protein n=1 Tax=Tilletiopsis washingtonensis TaxID=58919 RepID=A0A316Z0B5_9BASI|nr:hypothetical protein FA09DRAFT_332646 [Tilletiopsis washingtonensis]PWN94736.1 hypothetical protein FA09DRAFT_332646 [Tilletiopsis washingtonensis]